MLRNSLVVFVCAALFFAACKKENNPIEKKASEKIIGKWVWLSTQGGIGGVTVKPNPGEITVLEFFADKSYRISKNNSVIKSGVYRIEKVNSIFTNIPEDALFTDNRTSGQIIHFTNQGLDLTDNFVDAFTHHYKAIKPFGVKVIF